MNNIVDDNDLYFRLKGNCEYCHHLAHCHHSCLDEACDHCTECGCLTCKLETEKNLGYN